MMRSRDGNEMAGWHVVDIESICWSFKLRWGWPMNRGVLTVVEHNQGWYVRLDGVNVVSYFGPRAQEWAFREREELAQLLEAQPYGQPYDCRDRAYPLATPP